MMNLNVPCAKQWEFGASAKAESRVPMIVKRKFMGLDTLEPLLDGTAQRLGSVEAVSPPAVRGRLFTSQPVWAPVGTSLLTNQEAKPPEAKSVRRMAREGIVADGHYRLAVRITGGVAGRGLLRGGGS